MANGAKMQCLVCGSPMVAIKPWVNRCPRCDFWQSSLAGGAGCEIAGIETLRRENFAALLDRMARNVPAGAPILEVGCGRGWFLDEAARRGFRSVAVEPADDVATEVAARGHVVHRGFFPDALPPGGTTYSAIVFNDVFEHLPDPAGALAASRRLLADDGLLVINLPTSDGILFRTSRLLAAVGMPGPFERLWQKGLASPHLTYFSPSTLKAFMEGNGFGEVEQFPLASMRVAGLWARLRSTQGVASSALMYPALAVLALAASSLPSDIHVGMFRKHAA